MKAHRTDIVSFAFGLTFLALALWWLLAHLLGLTLPPVGWFLAGALVLIGLLGLLGALRSARHPDRNATAEGEATVSAPYEDGARPWTAPASPEADEWPTDAVSDVRTEALEDQPADPADEPHWSPYLPPDEPAAPDRPESGPGPVTAEQPTISDGSDRTTGPTGGENRTPG